METLLRPSNYSSYNSHANPGFEEQEWLAQQSPPDVGRVGCGMLSVTRHLLRACNVPVATLPAMGTEIDRIGWTVEEEKLRSENE